MPSPWLAIKHAKDALKKDRKGRLACFSPCAEQVQRTLVEIQNQGFVELEMFEVINRPLEAEEIICSPLPEASNDLDANNKRPLTTVNIKQIFSRFKAEIKGHTSYLYFASLLPECDAPSVAVDSST